jgi:cell division protein FtsI/penicillin-binding protein 2
MDVAKVIQKSSNIGTAKIALMLGDERVCSALQLFGFGTTSGLPFPNETRGVKPVPNPRDKLAITRMPIGYAMSTSILQLTRAYCGLANPQGMPQLRLIDRIEDPESGEVEIMPIAPLTKVFENESIRQTLVDMMINVTREGGTATRAAIKGFTVAGKTGTSNKYIPGVGYSARQYYGSFAGFVPAKSPRLVMVVSMDSPSKKGRHGGTVAAPVFRRTAARVLRYWNVAPEFDPEKQDDVKK